MVVGGICLDLISKSYTENKDKLLETSTPGKIDLTPGGVGFNITQVLHQLKTKPSFHSAVGDDLFGNYLLSQLSSKNIDFENIRKLKIESDKASTLTAVYSGLYSKSGNMLGAVADMDVFNKIDISSILSYIETQKPKIICLDGNLSEDALAQIIAKGREEGSFIAFEPTSVHKSTKIPEFPSVHLVTPNTLELVEMYSHYIAKDPKFSLNAKELKDVSVIEELAIHLLDHFPYLLVKMGSQGVMLVTRKFSAYLKPEAQVESPVNVSGAGDTLVGTIVAELSKLDNAFEADKNWWCSALNKGQFNARLTLNSKLTVSELIQ
jgi:sugar/nucleoside kinase (ribokinase family)